MLRIKKFVLEVDLWEAWLAIKRKTSIPCDLLHIDEVEFHAERNSQNALNLWVALDLPDQDVNAVARYVRDNVSAKQQTLEFAADAWESKDDDGDQVHSSPTAACQPPQTSVKKKSASKKTSFLSSLFASCRSVKKKTQKKNPSTKMNGITEEERPPYLREDTSINDPRRRPRWGVPFLFDIQRLVATKITLNILDLLLVRSHTLASYGESCIRIDHVDISHALLLRPDPRIRKYGIYLGELVWCLIHVLIKKIVKSKPSRLVTHSTIAVAFAMTDLAHYAIARTLEIALNAPPTASRFTSVVSRGFISSEHLLLGEGNNQNKAGILRIRLLRGRRLAVVNGTQGYLYASTHVRLLLRQRKDVSLGNDLPITPGIGGPLVLDRAKSSVKLWTPTPRWNETFSLGSVSDIRTIDLVILVLRNSYWSPTQSNLAVGEIVIPLLSVFGGNSHAISKRRKSNKSNEIVAWFRLALPSDDSFGILDTIPPADLHDEKPNLPENIKRSTSTDDLSENPIPSEHHSFGFSSNGLASMLQDTPKKKSMNLLLGEVKIGIQLNHIDKCTGFEIPPENRLPRRLSLSNMARRSSRSLTTDLSPPSVRNLETFPSEDDRDILSTTSILTP
eukprot:CAMPEP_0197316782 /NCGR_PEP_ID=MMETSP0891-20130614/44082_1 /TAXON_ID=44058 ORGANISM="Aureoumbra lagunensis, Strain CCMP1510" /NCGR_SAMPLE_ID=MMETSP0891 /ASSEMBLY_ACC=CAM_ASM_000534 /LENGTH=618 /DNA_ID=CAMNT_0042806411 /DNA_START=343 /DNA_END=2199 /DNA_ORIENTATION=-